MLHCGIVGLPLSGKTTIFNVITKAGAEVKPYAGGKTDPNRAVVDVPDARFDSLVIAHEPRKTTPARVEFVDLAGLSRGAGRGEGLGNAFLSFVADADAMLHVIRCFGNDAVEHPEGSVEPARDWDILEMELIFRDLGVVENRLGRLSAKKKPTPEEAAEKALLDRCHSCLLDERPLREMDLSPEEAPSLRGFSFVTSRPQLIVLNMDETQKSLEDVPGGTDVQRRIERSGARAITVYGRLEMDLMDLSPEEASEFTEGLPMSEPARDRLIAGAYSLLGLISFFTCGPDEVRAWTLHDGDSALEAARTIHSDLAKGFIRAQVVSYDDYSANNNSFATCRDIGVLRLEGRDYRVNDGDVIEIRFNI
ncbi:MAG: redox-regulated ATPase YchF [Synergistaceae bacterium]|jgi:GTP-binding protein YchF|nr:redox-regulated ATPase YchF [Synergistaceae bacterium]